MKHNLTGMAARAIAEMAKFGSIACPASARDVRSAEAVIYLVANGENVLQLGKGSSSRARSCMRGELAKKHNKAFICAMGEVALASPNTYAIVEMGSLPLAEAAERAVHAALDIRTNRDGATTIRGIEGTCIRDIHVGLWRRVKESVAFCSRLDTVEREMAEELFELVTFGTTVVNRRSGPIRSTQGDNLEGNILMRVERRYLANVFLKLSDHYLRYGKHRMSDTQFAASKAGYTYTPHGCRFDLAGS